MFAQLKKIEIDKWCEGENRQSDPGYDFVFHWIQNRGAWFRQAWESSLCKGCQRVNDCGHEVRQQCNEFLGVINE